MAPTPTHYLVLAPTPRPTFMQDMTPPEREIMLQHSAYLREQLAKGTLLLGGPCLDGAYGVVIYKVTTEEQVRKLLAEDPAVIGGIFKPEIHPMSINLLAK